MPPKTYIRPFWYAVADYLSAAFAWASFYFARKAILNEPFTIDYKFWLGTLFIPAGWLVLYALIGSYQFIYKKSRLSEATNAFVCALIGCTALFFLFLIDDNKSSNNYYYTSYFTLLGLHLFFTLVARILVLNLAKKQLRQKWVQFSALMVGTPSRVHHVHREAQKSLAEEGYRVAGFISTQEGRTGGAKDLPLLGLSSDLEKVIDERRIKLVVLAVEKKRTGAARIASGAFIGKRRRCQN